MASETPAALLTSIAALAFGVNAPWTSMDCGALPANENTVGPDDGLNVSVAPDFTCTSPRIAAPPRRFTLSVPCVTMRLSIVTWLPPVGDCVPPLLNSKSAYVRPDMDGVIAPSSR